MAIAATVSSKGQVVIPTRLRKKYGLRTGTRIVFLEKDDQLVIAPQTTDAVLALCGKYAGLELEKELIEDRRREREREDRRLEEL